MPRFKLFSVFQAIFFTAVFGATMRNVLVREWSITVPGMACVLGGLIAALEPQRTRTALLAFARGAFATVAVCIAASFCAVALFVFVAIRDFKGFMSSPPRIELLAVTGSNAAQKLTELWPQSIDPNQVNSVHFAGEGSRDSYSAWWRVELSPDVAKQWIARAHANQEHSMNDHFRGKAEGLRRTIAGPPPVERPTGPIPTWWTPPTQACDATEVMRWYENSGTGYGHVTYTTYDLVQGVLWIYQSTCQHHRLWTKGAIPSGERLPGSRDLPEIGAS
jgi:hypothetical protein